ncbi:MAG: hypothetical protein JRE23_03360 [Deltaproteobacteria bacterium]|nr:hypothetical protein [Deltaproteobacteria bacterium]
MSASAIVTVSLKVALCQPWSDKATVAEVIKQAKHDAITTVGNLIGRSNHVSICDEPKVKVIYEERK